MRAIVVYRQDGLGSRLMAFGNGLRLARVLGVPCHLVWTEAHRIGRISQFGQLLDESRLTSNVSAGRLDEILGQLRPSRMMYADDGDILDREAVAGSDVLFCVSSRMQRLDDEVRSPALARGFAAAAKCLMPVPPLVARARAFGARYDLRAAIGVHVRRGDLVDNRIERDRLRLIGLDHYFSVLDAISARRPLFLCTEDLAVVDAFRARYPGRVLRYPTTSWTRADRQAAASALIEMFLLGATRLVVAGPSAFSRFAAARRPIPLVVLKNGDSPKESIAQAEAAARV
jgi:hypothetical protein